jgi:hypothetical protein
MKDIRWSEEKDAMLRSDPDRGGFGLAECAEAIQAGRLLDVVPNPSANHVGQRMFVLNFGGYAYCVPFVEDEATVFLKTLYPSRRLTALYLERRQ